MKKLLFGALGLMILSGFMQSCEDLLGDLLDFDTGYYSVNFTINEEDEIGAYVWAQEAIRSDIDSLLDKNGLSRDNIDEVTIKEVIFLINNEDTSYNFNPIKSAKASLSADKVIERIVAEVDDVPDGVREIVFDDLKDTDVKAYLLSSEFKLKTSGVIDEPITDAIDVKAKIRFKISAKL